jgi:hypothetical protein
LRARASVESDGEQIWLRDEEPFPAGAAGDTKSP